MAAGAAAASPLVPDERFARSAGEDALRRAAAALTAKGFTVEILDDVGAARARVRDLLAQKVVPDLDAALRRLEAYALPLEDARARAVYGVPTAANEVLIVSGDHVPGRSVVLLPRQPIGY